MARYEIHGGVPLNGSVTISGAKNAAVAILPAALMVNGICRIENVPDISDVRILLDILQGMGVKILRFEDGVVELDSGLAELKAKLTDKGLDLLSGDVQKALDILDATESQLASELSYDLVADGMSHDLLYVIRTQMK